VAQSGRALPSDIRSITFAIQDADAQVTDLGFGDVEKLYHGHEDTFGVFAFEGALSGSLAEWLAILIAGTRT
jgi:hypothetical protein